MAREKPQSLQRRADHVPTRIAPVASPAAPTVDAVLGNQAMQQLLATGAIKPKLRVSRPGDPSEEEADRVADAVMRMPTRQGNEEEVCAGRGTPSPACATEGVTSVQRRANGENRASGVSMPESFASGLGPGRPLDGATRAFFEQRFGRDFREVRVHAHAAAAETAASVDARAYTVGSQIVFASGEYRPDSLSGRRLLAHELTHVAQQRGGALQLQRQESGASAPRAAGTDFWFSVNIDRAMSSDELLLAFVMQYRGVDAAAAAGMIGASVWHWTGTPPSVSDADVRSGYKLIHVRDRSLTPATPSESREHRRYFGGLSAAERQAITSETDRRFWERTQYRPGERLGSTPDDRRMASYWMTLRDELIRQRRDIDALPQAIRDFIFAETGRRLQPQEYAAVLRIAAKLMEMSEAERQAYLARTSARTDDLSVFESALDRYRIELRQRREASVEREQAKGALLGLDAVYREYRAYKSLLSTSAGLGAMGAANPRALGTALGTQPTLNRMREELTAHLEAHGYHSIGEFEAAIRVFEAAFRDETALIAREMLGRYEHLLRTQEERYRDAAATRGLHQQLGTARASFEEAYRIREQHASAVVMTLEEAAEQSYWSGQFNARMAQGRAQVSALSGEHPLLGNSDIPAESLATAGEAALPGELQGYIRARRTDVQATRQNIESHPDLVWELDSLLQQAMVEQDIRPNSIYQLIIQDHIRDASIERALINLAVAVFAIAAGLVSMGTGTVAVLGAGAAFGVSAYQAWEEFRRYETQSAAHGAQLLSDDPSFAWVVVALVGAGFDLAGIASALRPVRSAVQTFNRTGDLVELETELTRLRRLGEIDGALQENVIRAARAEAEANEAWRAARARYYGAAYAVIDPLVTPLINLAVHFTYPVYLSLRRGIIGLERFLLTREAASLIGDFHQLSPAQMARVRSAWQLAFNNAQQVAAHGHSLGMLDAEIEQFLRMWNRSPALSADDLMRQMDQWAAPLRSRPAARARIAPDMILDPASRARLSDFEHQIAGTGGIERIIAREAPNEGRLAVTIEGEVLPGRLTRRPQDVTPTRRRAPDFNRSGSLFSVAEAGLDANWQRLHLWGPGFGDEAAAGMMWGPRTVNLVWQNDSIESYIRQLAELSRRHGGRTRVRATAISWENPTPGGWSAPQGEHFLKQVEYEITLVRPGEPNQTIRVTLEVGEPPATTVRPPRFDPPSAVNLGDLF